MALGKQIRHYRNAHGWRLEELADRSGVELGTISALEVRDSKKSAMAPALAKALGLSLEQLLDEKNDWFCSAATRVMSAEVDARLEAVDTGQAPVQRHNVSDLFAEQANHPAWPFSTSLKQFFKVLNADDIRTIDAFIQGVVKTRHSQNRKRK